MTRHCFLAFDIGAESGRAMLGVLDGQKLTIRELTRFPNGMVNVSGHWHWEILRLYEEIKKSLKNCSAQVESVGFDTWGVDYALLGEKGELLGLPFAYRDDRTGIKFAEELLGKSIDEINKDWQKWVPTVKNSRELR